MPDRPPAGPVLILTPTGRDAVCAQHVLMQRGIACRICPSLDALCDALDDTTGAVLVADEALAQAETARLAEHLSHQEPWSDLPFVVLTQPASRPSTQHSRAEAHLPEALGNVMFLERPLYALTLISAVRTALRARLRQRQVRSYVAERIGAAERLAESEARFRTLATGIQQLVFLSRSDGSRTWSSPQWVEFTGLSLEESADFGWLAAIHPEDRELTRQHWAAAEALGAYYVEHRVRRSSDGAFRWHQTRARPFDPERKSTREWVGASTDVHDLRELQEQQAVLVAELQHRTRNLIGVVRSLADRTLADSLSLDEFQDRFRDCLAALARVQGLFSRKGAGQKVTFDELIRMELTGLGAIDQAGHGPQVMLDGPEGVRLRSSTVQTFALALHELATNAIKYGALARPEGRLRVCWSLTDKDADEWRLRVDWQESGVPVALPPDGSPVQRGYGRELIERALPFQLSAETAYELTPEGVRCTITLPISIHDKEIADA